MPQGTFQKKAGRVQWAKNLGAVHTKGGRYYLQIVIIIEYKMDVT